MTELKKTKAPAKPVTKTVPVKKVTKAPCAPVKVNKVAMVTKAKPDVKPSVVVTKSSVKAPAVNVKKPTTKIQEKIVPSNKKTEISKTEVTSFMQEMQKQAL